LADYAIHFPPNLLKNHRFGGLCCSFSAKSEKAPSAKPTYGGGFVLKNFAVSEIKNIFAKNYQNYYGDRHSLDTTLFQLSQSLHFAD
jgi:hypothetical protein